MRLRAIAAVALLAAVTAMAPAHAGTKSATWTATASGTSTGTVDLRAPVDLQLEETINDVFFGRRANVIQMRGRFGGLIIRDGSGAVVAGLLRYAGATSYASWGHYNDDYRQILRPGRYRVTVFGDGPVTVSLPVRGDVDHRIALSLPAKAVFTDQHDAGPVQAAAPAAAFNATLTLGKRSSYVVLAAMSGPLPGADVQSLCLTPATNATCAGATQNAVFPSGGIVSSRGAQLQFVDEVGDLPSGDYAVRYTVAQGGASYGHALFTAVFEAPA